MVSAWFWKSIRLQFSLYYNFSIVPVSWNSKTRTFEFEWKNLLQFKLFYFHIYFVLGFLLQGSCFSVVICYFTHPRLQVYLSIEYVFVYLLFGVAIFFPLIAATISPYYFRDEVYVMNNMLMTDNKLERICRDREYFLFLYL